MTAVKSADVAAQRAQNLDKIQITVKTATTDTFILKHYRMTLLFDEAVASLDNDHRAAIDSIVERSKQHNIWVTSIIGHASEPGSSAENQTLSLSRAQAVQTYLKQAADAALPAAEAVVLYSSSDGRVQGKGETDLLAPTFDEGEHPLNRRVVINYKLKIVFPGADDPANVRSTMWKLEFGAATTQDLWLLEGGAGIGQLTMLPDGASSAPLSAETRPVHFEYFGLSLDIGSFLKVAKLGAKLPGVEKILKKMKQLAESTDAATDALLTHQQNLLKALGVDLSLVAGGGEFETQEPLSWSEISTFNYSVIEAGIQVAGKAGGSVLLLDSPQFFASTVLYDVGPGGLAPDLNVKFVPAGVVSVLPPSTPGPN